MQKCMWRLKSCLLYLLLTLALFLCMQYGIFWETLIIKIFYILITTFLLACLQICLGPQFFPMVEICLKINNGTVTQRTEFHDYSS